MAARKYDIQPTPGFPVNAASRLSGAAPLQAFTPDMSAMMPRETRMVDVSQLFGAEYATEEIVAGGRELAENLAANSERREPPMEDPLATVLEIKSGEEAKEPLWATLQYRLGPDSKEERKEAFEGIPVREETAIALAICLGFGQNTTIRKEFGLHHLPNTFDQPEIKALKAAMVDVLARTQGLDARRDDLSPNPALALGVVRGILALTKSGPEVEAQVPGMLPTTLTQKVDDMVSRDNNSMDIFGPLSHITGSEIATFNDHLLTQGPDGTYLLSHLLLSGLLPPEVVPRMQDELPMTNTLETEKLMFHISQVLGDYLDVFGFMRDWYGKIPVPHRRRDFRFGIEVLQEALRKIVDGNGRYGPDQKEHAKAFLDQLEPLYQDGLPIQETGELNHNIVASVSSLSPSTFYRPPRGALPASLRMVFNAPMVPLGTVPVEAIYPGCTVLQQVADETGKLVSAPSIDQFILERYDLQRALLTALSGMQQSADVAELIEGKRVLGMAEVVNACQRLNNILSLGKTEVLPLTVGDLTQATMKKRDDQLGVTYEEFIYNLLRSLKEAKMLKHHTQVSEEGVDLDVDRLFTDLITSLLQAQVGTQDDITKKDLLRALLSPNGRLSLPNVCSLVENSLSEKRPNIGSFYISEAEALKSRPYLDVETARADLARQLVGQDRVTIDAAAEWAIKLLYKTTLDIGEPPRILAVSGNSGSGKGVLTNAVVRTMKWLMENGRGIYRRAPIICREISPTDLTGTSTLRGNTIGTHLGQGLLLDVMSIYNVPWQVARDMINEGLLCILTGAEMLGPVLGEMGGGTNDGHLAEMQRSVAASFLDAFDPAVPYNVTVELPGEAPINLRVNAAMIAAGCLVELAQEHGFGPDELADAANISDFEHMLETHLRPDLLPRLTPIICSSPTTASFNAAITNPAGGPTRTFEQALKTMLTSVYAHPVDKVKLTPDAEKFILAKVIQAPELKKRGWRSLNQVLLELQAALAAQFSKPGFRDRIVQMEGDIAVAKIDADLLRELLKPGSGK